MSRMPQQGEIYRHFKGNLYQITAIASDSESLEQLVVYQALYGDFKYYVRKLDMFTSEVDKDKHPEVNQKYRFELVSKDVLGLNKNINIDDNIADDNECKKDYLEQFFDAKYCNDKIKILKEMNENNAITEHILDVAASSIDCVLTENGIDDKYYSLLRVLNTKAKYEISR